MNACERFSLTDEGGEMLVWRPENLEIAVIFLSFTLFYLLYHFEVLDASFRGLNSGSKRSNQVTAVFIHRVLGTVLLGVFPGMCARLIVKKNLFEYGFTLSFSPWLLLVAFALCALLFPVLFFYSRSPEAAENAPQARPAKWNAALVLLNACTWVTYLIAYELCMRGYILLSLARNMGGWPAIFIMTAIYTAIHLPKGRGEAAGSAVIGIVFGVLTLIAGSIFIAVIIHVFVALTIDMLLIVRKRRN